MARSLRDVLVAAAFAVLALVFLVEGRALPFESRGIPGPGLFPFLLSVAILCFSAVLAVVAVVLHRRQDDRAPLVHAGDTELKPAALEDDTGIATDDSEPRSRRRAIALWALVLAVSLSLPVVGFLPAMLLLTVVLMLGMERRYDVVSLVSAVAVPLAFYFLFATLLDVRLPSGIFG